MPTRMFIVGISFEMLLGIITPGMVIAIHDGMITSMSGERTTRNPFFFGDLALDEAFTDRDEELASLEQDMLNGQYVALIAPRRYGKSSLVRRASQRDQSARVLAAPPRPSAAAPSNRFCTAGNTPE